LADLKSSLVFTESGSRVRGATTIAQPITPEREKA
jgi:hypothetical protein